MAPLPKGFTGITFNAGLKKHPQHDCLLVRSTHKACSAAMFTQSLFAGPSVLISKNVPNRSDFQGLVVLSKNANVATGEVGEQDALSIRKTAARILELEEEQVLIASTGIIGQPYPMKHLMNRLNPKTAADLYPVTPLDAAASIMTTDTRPKYYETQCSQARIVGIAKGVGMIEPNMATMLAFFFTDADLDKNALNAVFRRVVAKTFNATSIDSDTSTSDTAAIFSNGLAGKVSIPDFEHALYECALALVKMITRDGEGATKSLVVKISGARDNDQAKRAAKAVVNSPLVKTAIHGADPNWGRIVMAIGKLEQDKDIQPQNVTISFGKEPVYPPKSETPHNQTQLKDYLQREEIEINIGLGICEGSYTAYGCDLSEGYIRINADYTT